MSKTHSKNDFKKDEKGNDFFELPELIFKSKRVQSEENISIQKGTFFQIYNRNNELLISNDENCSNKSKEWAKGSRDNAQSNNFELQKEIRNKGSDAPSDAKESSFDSELFLKKSFQNENEDYSHKSSIDIFKKKQISENSLFSFDSKDDINLLKTNKLEQSIHINKSEKKIKFDMKKLKIRKKTKNNNNQLFENLKKKYLKRPKCQAFQYKKVEFKKFPPFTANLNLNGNKNNKKKLKNKRNLNSIMTSQLQTPKQTKLKNEIKEKKKISKKIDWKAKLKNLEKNLKRSTHKKNELKSSKLTQEKINLRYSYHINTQKDSFQNSNKNSGNYFVNDFPFHNSDLVQSELFSFPK